MENFKKNIAFLIIIVIAGLSFSCEEDNVSISSLRGNWIEVSGKTDTLIFNENDSLGMLFLNREKEFRAGHMLPKFGTGPYDYEIMEDSITLRSGYSSCMCTESYEFKILPDKNKLHIGNFYSDDIAYGELLLFERL